MDRCCGRSPQPWPHCDDDHPRTASPRRDQSRSPWSRSSSFAADVLELPSPCRNGIVLQVLWCPFDHEHGYVPRPEVFWRDSSLIDVEAAAPPRPTDSPTTTTSRTPLRPASERVTDYPNWGPCPRRRRGSAGGQVRRAGGGDRLVLLVAPSLCVGGHQGRRLPDLDPGPVSGPRAPSCARRMGPTCATINSRRVRRQSWRTWLPRRGHPRHGHPSGTCPTRALTDPVRTGTDARRHGAASTSSSACAAPTEPFAYHSDGS